MKIVVLGKTGQLGQYLMEDLQAAGYQVLGFNSAELDVTQSQTLKKVLIQTQPRIVINCTAYNQVAAAESNPTFAFQVNAVAVGHISEACQQLKARFITFSTDYVFDGQESHPYKENDHPQPLQIYGVTKLAGEFLALAHNKNTVVVRTSGLYGKKGSSQKGSNFVLDRLKDAEEYQEIEVAGNQWCTPTYAGDLSSAICTLLNTEFRGLLHIANQGSCSWAEFTQEVYRLTSQTTKIKTINRDWRVSLPYRPSYTVLDTTQAQHLGIALPKWQIGIRKYLQELSLLS